MAARRLCASVYLCKKYLTLLSKCQEVLTLWASLHPLPPPSLNPYEGLSNEDIEMIEETCSSDPDAQRFFMASQEGSTPSEVALDETWDSADADSRTTKLVDELDACFQTRGMEADRERIGYPKQADMRVLNEDQIAMALKTVECKDQIDFTQRMVDILAEYQMKVINKYADELISAREAFDEKVEAAKQYIADNPDDFLMPEEQ